MMYTITKDDVTITSASLPADMPAFAVEKLNAIGVQFYRSNGVMVRVTVEDDSFWLNHVCRATDDGVHQVTDGSCDMCGDKNFD